MKNHPVTEREPEPPPGSHPAGREGPSSSRRYRARRLEKALETPARIYYKYEGVSAVGSHKPNTAVAQAYYNQQEGVARLTTETGAGQWGSALAFSCNFFDLECKVYMVKVSYEQKPYRRSMMQSWGASVVASPSNETNAGRQTLERDPESPGSLGIAISEAVEEAAGREDTKYSLGSVLNHVLLHQTDSRTTSCPRRRFKKLSTRSRICRSRFDRSTTHHSLF